MTLDETMDNLSLAKRHLELANQGLSALIDRVKSVTDEHDGSNIQQGKLEDACRIYFYTTEKYDELDEVRKKIGAQLDHMSREVIPGVMEERGVRNITLDDVQRQFSKSVRVTASMADKPEALDWLKDNGFGDLIQSTVNSSTLSSFAKQYIEDYQKDLPDCFKMNTMTVTSVRKSVKGEK